MATIVNSKDVDLSMEATSLYEEYGSITLAVTGKLIRRSSGKLEPYLAASFQYYPGLNKQGGQVYPTGTWAVELVVDAEIKGITTTIATYSGNISPGTMQVSFNTMLTNSQLLNIGFDNSSIKLSAGCRIRPSAGVTEDILRFAAEEGTFSTGDYEHGIYHSFYCGTTSNTISYDNWYVPIKLYKTDNSDFIDISNKMKVRVGSTFKTFTLRPNHLYIK